MGKPRLIILIRHAQSEGNKNRAIHQMIPDHRVKLTDEGRRQAEDAGHRLRHLLNPSDSLQIFTSPYRRTRETTEGILKTLTANSDAAKDDATTTSPFSRSKIKVYEEPRLREQDFGNFQPSSEAMETMWRERADYGHFFYRIPNGESAADAYDRISGFNESLWRQFGEDDFPSVLVLVTHGLMSRVFLMKWYHWSVEYFEDLRNVNHCEFVLMRQNMESGKFGLESQLRTWSELKRQRREAAEAESEAKNPSRRNTLSAFLKAPVKRSPSIPAQQWNGKQGKDGHKNFDLPPPAEAESTHKVEAEDHALGSEQPMPTSGAHLDGSKDISDQAQQHAHPLPSYLTSNTSHSGDTTPHEMPSDDEGDYFQASNDQPQTSATSNPIKGGSLATALRRARPERKPTEEDIERWSNESGMGRGKQADALGDEPAPESGREQPSSETDQDRLSSVGEGGFDRLKHRRASGRAGAEEDLRKQLEELELAEKEDKGVEGSVY